MLSTVASPGVPVNLARRVVAEGLGTAFLVAAVIGSGIMAQRLAGPDVALALLANTLATGGALVALILTFGPISGAQFNPIVTLWLASTRAVSWRDAAALIVAQVVGAVAGALLANTMFGLAPVSWAATRRGSLPLLVSEVVATFGLLGVIISTTRRQPSSTPFAVAAYVIAAYWFTASTAFANPAVTIARCVSDTFAGIRPGDVPGFVAAQLVGGAAATITFGWLVPRQLPAA